MRRLATTVAVLMTAGLTWAGEGAVDRATLRTRILEQAPALRSAVLDLALAAYDHAAAAGDVRRERLTIIDYELPSWTKRMWVIDVATSTVLHHEWVAHGMGAPAGSGGDFEHLRSVSNRPGTRKSSVGLYVTAETYIGRHGRSLRLDGLEPGFNDAARDRAIVLHGADYVTAARARDRLVGRSWGCPAVRPKIAQRLIDDISNGSVLWIYYPVRRWLTTSRFLAPLDAVSSG
jgi:hypothetical protein